MKRQTVTKAIRARRPLGDGRFLEKHQNRTAVRKYRRARKAKARMVAASRRRNR